MKHFAILIGLGTWLLGAAGAAGTTSRAVDPFTLPWVNGAENQTTYDSTTHKNSVFVVEAYFLRCPYCNDNAPAVNDLAADYADEPRVQVLDVGRDTSDADYAEWIRRHSPNHPVLKDTRRTLLTQLGTSAYPSTYVLDCNLQVVYSTVGAWSQSTARTLRRVIDEQLASMACLNSR